uniref:Uncharacterized protein n=1 Tax=Lepeophtheirus salmonis TaxID=72036 RepID=A0A0K2TN31_LEPSM
MTYIRVSKLVQCTQFYTCIQYYKI